MKKSIIHPVKGFNLIRGSEPIRGYRADWYAGEKFSEVDTPFIKVDIGVLNRVDEILAFEGLPTLVDYTETSRNLMYHFKDTTVQYYEPSPKLHETFSSFLRISASDEEKIKNVAKLLDLPLEILVSQSV